MAQIVIPKISVTQSATRSRTGGGYVVINPKCKILAEAPRTYDCQRIGHKQICLRCESGRLQWRRLFGVPIEIARITETNRYAPGDFAGIEGFGERFFLGLGSKQDRWLFDKLVIILGELEPVLLEGFPEIVQFRVITVAG